MTNQQRLVLATIRCSIKPSISFARYWKQRKRVISPIETTSSFKSGSPLSVSTSRSWWNSTNRSVLVHRNFSPNTCLRQDLLISNLNGIRFCRALTTLKRERRSIEIVVPQICSCWMSKQTNSSISNRSTVNKIELCSFFFDIWLDCRDVNICNWSIEWGIIVVSSSPSPSHLKTHDDGNKKLIVVIKCTVTRRVHSIVSYRFPASRFIQCGTAMSWIIMLNRVSRASRCRRPSIPMMICIKWVETWSSTRTAEFFFSTEVDRPTIDQRSNNCKIVKLDHISDDNDRKFDVENWSLAEMCDVSLVFFLWYDCPIKCIKRRQVSFDRRKARPNLVAARSSIHRASICQRKNPIETISLMKTRATLARIRLIRNKSNKNKTSIEFLLKMPPSFS